jgi:hypothetical protein
MAYLSANNRQYIERMKSWYEAQPLVVKQLFSSRVNSAILSYQSGTEDESIYALELCRAFLNEDGSINRGSISAGHLEEFLESPLMSSVSELNRRGLLAGDDAQANFDNVAGYQAPRGLAQATVFFHPASVVTGNAAQANRDTVAGHQDPSLVAAALRLLNGGGLLPGNAVLPNRGMVRQHGALGEAMKKGSYK